MKTYAVRLRRGADLLESIEKLCTENAIKAGVLLSAVGCVIRVVSVMQAGSISLILLSLWR